MPIRCIHVFNSYADHKYLNNILFFYSETLNDLNDELLIQVTGLTYKIMQNNKFHSVQLKHKLLASCLSGNVYI
jgi:hypothetical protein